MIHQDSHRWVLAARIECRRFIPTYHHVRNSCHPCLIETENLTKKFGDVTAVDGVTLRVNEGEVFGFLGPNGAGKTTTVRMLACLISKSSGRAWVCGLEVGSGDDDAQQIRRRIGVLPETVGLYDDLSVQRNLDYFAKLYEVDSSRSREYTEGLLKVLDLWEKRDRPVGTFSKGTKQKVAIARALVHDPAVVFLDEPTANLDPEASRTIREFILELKKKGKTIFLNTHNLDEAQRVCDRVAIMRGRLLAQGTPADLRRSLWRTLTSFTIAGPLEPAIKAIGEAGDWKVSRAARPDQLLVEVDDPAKDNPRVIRALVDSRIDVLFVTEVSPSLEDVYIGLVREKN